MIAWYLEGSQAIGFIEVEEKNKFVVMFSFRIKSNIETQSLEDELNEIEDTFRNPNLLIESIKEMQQKKEESLKKEESNE